MSARGAAVTIAAGRSPSRLEEAFAHRRQQLARERVVVGGAGEDQRAHRRGRREQRVLAITPCARLEDGVDAAEQPLERMWARFFTTRADRGGTGLGLPIVTAAAKAHGGRVTCASSDDATTFVLTLPRAAP